MNSEMQEFLQEDFEPYFVIWQNSRSGAPDQALCQQIQNMMPDVTVLYDRDTQLRSVGLANRHVHFVLEEGSRISFRQAFSEAGFKNAIRDTLAD
ncbi:MAG: hypothetical protein RIU46_37235 [Deltaproteobacteria bacterium]